MASDAADDQADGGTFLRPMLAIVKDSGKRVRRAEQEFLDFAGKHRRRSLEHQLEQHLDGDDFHCTDRPEDESADQIRQTGQINFSCM